MAPAAAQPTGPYVASGHIKSGLPSAVDKMIPDAMKACLTGWEEDTGKKKFTVVKAQTYDDMYMRSGLLNSYVQASTSMSRLLASAGLDATASNTLNYLVSDPVFADLASHATQQLVTRDLVPTNSLEYRRFLAHKLLRSRFKMSASTSWTEMMGPVAQKHHFSLMPQERYSNILTCVRGYDVTSRSGYSGDEAWIQRKNMLRKLNVLEVNIFKNSMLIMNTEDGEFCTDDELHSTRAQDVECKAFSDRKAGSDVKMMFTLLMACGACHLLAAERAVPLIQSSDSYRGEVHVDGVC